MVKAPKIDWYDKIISVGSYHAKDQDPEELDEGPPVAKQVVARPRQRAASRTVTCAYYPLSRTVL